MQHLNMFVAAVLGLSLGTFILQSGVVDITDNLVHETRGQIYDAARES